MLRNSEKSSASAFKSGLDVFLGNISSKSHLMIFLCIKKGADERIMVVSVLKNSDNENHVKSSSKPAFIRIATFLVFLSLILSFDTDN